MADERPRTARSLAASAIGWILVAVVAFWLVRIAFGTLFGFVRGVIWFVLMAALVWLYFRLRSSGDDT